MSDEETLSIHSSFLFYQTEDGKQRIEVRLEEETVWLTQRLMSELFQTTPENITIHLKNIFAEGELDPNSVAKESLVTARDGKKYRTKLYRLEAIIAVGYRVQSNRGTQFRQWATQRLQEYIVKGFTMDDQRLANPSGLDYFDELFERIRAIRASEKRFYQKIRDIYLLSADYDMLRAVRMVIWRDNLISKKRKITSSMENITPEMERWMENVVKCMLQAT